MIKTGFRRFTRAQFSARRPSQAFFERSKDVEVCIRVTVGELTSKQEYSFKLKVLVNFCPFKGRQMVKVLYFLLKTLVVVHSLHRTSCKSRRFVFSEYLKRFPLSELKIKSLNII